MEIYGCAYISFYIDCVKFYPEAASKIKFNQSDLNGRAALNEAVVLNLGTA